MSPVQRTITMPVLLAGSIFIAVFFSACSDKIKTDINVYKALDEGLINSNIVIDNQSQTILASLKDKLSDPSTAEKAGVWYPKAQLIQKLSKDIYIYIEELKSDLKKEAGLKTDKGIESFRESDKNAVIRLFNKNGKGEVLYERMKKYRNRTLSVDLQLANAFNNTILLTTSSFDSSEGSKQDFTKTFFDDIPTIAALAMLSKFQNNIKNAENKTLVFCHNQIGSGARICTFYSPLVMQSSTYVRAGEMMEITAAIGSFVSYKTEVTINGKKMPVSEDGASHYKFKAVGKAGKHLIPVEISYIDQDGQKQTMTKNIEYTVAKEAEINN